MFKYRAHSQVSHFCERHFVPATKTNEATEKLRLRLNLVYKVLVGECHSKMFERTKQNDQDLRSAVHRLFQDRKPKRKKTEVEAKL